MTDDEYIRKAVELADGWGYNDIRGYFWTPTQGQYNFLPVELLDALAAQLARQADKIGDYFECTSSGSFVDMDDPAISFASFGPDRTMNTIKAIVDSKVLE